VPFVADLRTVLRGRDFRRLFAVRLVSQAGDGVFQVALASLVFFSPERAATAQAAAGAFAVTVLPYTLVGPFAGVLLDRWRRRQVLVVANAVRAAMVVGIAALVSRTSVGPSVYVAVLACLSVNRFFLAGLGASLPHVVPRHELVMANAVAPTCGTLAALAGGGIGYLLRAQLPVGDGGDAVTLLVASGVYVASAALATRMAPDLLGPDRDLLTERPTFAHGWHALVDGARHVRSRRPALHALGAIGVSRFAYGISTIATLLLCRNHFAAPTDVSAGLALLAQVFAASGVGFGLAALVTPPAAAHWGEVGWIRRCFTLAAVVQAVFVLWLPVPVALAGALLLGMAVQGSKICVDAIVQREVDDAYRGRVFAFYDVVFNVAFVAAAACAALVVPRDGFSPVLFGVIGALYAAAALAYGRASSRVRSSRTPAEPTTSAAAPPEPPPARPDRRPGAAAAGAGRPDPRPDRAARRARP
jgi:MFS family permease